MHRTTAIFTARGVEEDIQVRREREREGGEVEGGREKVIVKIFKIIEWWCNYLHLTRWQLIDVQYLEYNS